MKSGLFRFYLLHDRYPMQLVMYLGNDFIAAVSVNSKQIRVPGYMGRLKRQLMEENKQLLELVYEEPEFLILHASPSPSKVHQ